MRKSGIIVTLAVVLTAASFMITPGSPVTIQASAYNENYTGTYQDVLDSVSPKGAIIHDEYTGLKYRVVKPFSPSTGYIDKWSGNYILNLSETPGELEVVGHTNPKKQNYDNNVYIKIGQYIVGDETLTAPKLADGQAQSFYVTGIAKNAFKNDKVDLLSIENYPDYHYVGSDTLTIPDGAFKNCKNLKKIEILNFVKVEFKGKAFENAPINELTVWGDDRKYDPITWKVKKNTFKKVKSNNIKVSVFMSDYTAKSKLKKTAKTIRTALSKGGIKKSKIHAEYQYNGKMRKLK